MVVSLGRQPSGPGYRQPKKETWIEALGCTPPGLLRTTPFAAGTPRLGVVSHSPADGACGCCRRALGLPWIKNQF